MWALYPDPTPAEQAAADRESALDEIAFEHRRAVERRIRQDGDVQRIIREAERRSGVDLSDQQVGDETHIVFRPTYKPAWWPL